MIDLKSAPQKDAFRMGILAVVELEFDPFTRLDDPVENAVTGPFVVDIVQTARNIMNSATMFIKMKCVYRDGWCQLN